MGVWNQTGGTDLSSFLLMFFFFLSFSRIYCVIEFWANTCCNISNLAWLIDSGWNDGPIIGVCLVLVAP